MQNQTQLKEEEFYHDGRREHRVLAWLASEPGTHINTARIP